MMCDQYGVTEDELASFVQNGVIEDKKIFNAMVETLNRIEENFSKANNVSVESTDNGIEITVSNVSTNGITVTSRIKINNDGTISRQIKIGDTEDSWGPEVTIHHGNGELDENCLYIETDNDEYTYVIDPDKREAEIRDTEGYQVARTLNAAAILKITESSLLASNAEIKVPESIQTVLSGQKIESVGDLIDMLNATDSSDTMVLCVITDSDGNIISIARNSQTDSTASNVLDVISASYSPSENIYNFNCAEMYAIDSETVF